MPDSTQRCSGCGCDVPPSQTGRGRPRKWCSEKCRNAVRYRGDPSHRENLRRSRERLRARGPLTQHFAKTCEQCGSGYSTSRRNGRFCSNICHHANIGNQTENGTDLASCVACRSLATRGNRSCRCSEGRQTMEHVVRIAKRRDAMAPRECVQCHGMFAPATLLAAVTGQKCCSKRCATTYNNSLPASKAARLEAKQRRRARKRNAYVADVNRAEIFERDKWTCQLCHDPLDMDASVPHPLAPTIDHIIPLAADGTHEPANVQAAHFLCNAQKGDRTFSLAGDQLRLAC